MEELGWEVYPQPNPDELFAKMQGGQIFYKIDLTQAYAQVELHEVSEEYLVINTCKGLKEYTLMTYDIKPATHFKKILTEFKFSN